MARPMSKSNRFSLANSRTPWHLLWNQPISMVIRMPWSLFLASVVGVFLVEVCIFWQLFNLDVTGITGTGSPSLPKTMVYSLQTLLGASFGALTPDSPYALSMSALECLTGIVTASVVTALFLARLLQTEAPLIFSSKLCLSTVEGGHLFCRFVTYDPSSWLNVRYSLSLFMDVELEGIWQRKILPLELMNPATPQLSLTATLTHPLDAESPFRQFSLEQLRRAKALLVYLVEGTDEITGSALLQVQSYGCDDIAVDHRFVDLVGLDRKGERHVFIERLDQIGRVDPPMEAPGPR